MSQLQKNLLVRRHNHIQTIKEEKKMNRYEIRFEMKYSHDIIVSAKNKKEAKKKAWTKFEKKIKKSMFNKYHVRDTE